MLKIIEINMSCRQGRGIKFSVDVIGVGFEVLTAVSMKMAVFWVYSSP
jgi:hypothetical protein